MFDFSDAVDVIVDELIQSSDPKTNYEQLTVIAEVTFNEYLDNCLIYTRDVVEMWQDLGYPTPDEITLSDFSTIAEVITTTVYFELSDGNRAQAVVDGIDNYITSQIQERDLESLSDPEDFESDTWRDVLESFTHSGIDADTVLYYLNK